MPTIYGIRNCDTMKRAFAWLAENDVAYDFIDYKKGGIVATRIADWSRRAGWQALLNTRGLTWRKLSDAEREDVDAAKALALMTQYPTLIKRPLLDTGSELLVGFDADLYGKHLK